MNEAQSKAIERMRRHFSIKGTVPLEGGKLLVGYEASADGRDMNRTLDQNGKIIEDRPSYTYG